MNKNNPKISVIVPVYNTAKYLDKCLDTLLNQTYSNLEIIIVEDCSKDNSKELLKSYEKYENIKIIYNEKNSGLSYSRNMGVRNATGEYIGFIDSDDYVELNYYETLMNSIKENNSEIAICDIKIVYEKTLMEQLSKCYTGNEFNLINVINNGLAASACNKLFKKSIISKYTFEVGRVNEDLAVVIPSVVEAKKISYAKTYYYYVQRGGSIQNSEFSDKRFDIIHGVDLTLERIKNHKEYNELAAAIIYNQIIVLLIYLIPNIKGRKRRKEVLKKFDLLSRKYEIRKNHYFWNFLEQTGTKHRLYYKMLFKLNCTGHYSLANNLISMYHFLSLFLKKGKVIPEDITLEKVIAAAKYQQSLNDEKYKVSVVIPNYNYARFLYQRIYSILSQNYKIYELIILDDCSKDNSKEVIDDIISHIKEYVNVKKIYNEKNSGSAFKQWQKGFKEATGDYVWIAEADDYCDPSLLKNLVKPILKNESIVISYSDTAFVDIFGNVTVKSIKPEIDISKTKHWNKSYINDGLNEIKNYSYLNCTIANVSSALIKNGNYNKYLTESGNYKQAGDWLFYINLMTLGSIAYTNKVLNYYRLHGDNVSSTMNYQKHLDEIKNIYAYSTKKFNLDSNHKKKMDERIAFLKKAWKIK